MFVFNKNAKCARLIFNSKILADKHGFSLAEVLIATSVLSIGLVGLLGSFHLLNRLQMKQHERLTAVQLAKSHCETAHYYMQQHGLAFFESGNTSNKLLDTDYPDSHQRFERKTSFVLHSPRLLEMLVTVTYPSGEIQVRTKLLALQ